MKFFVRSFGTMWVGTSALIFLSTLLHLPIFGVTDPVRVFDLGLTYSIVSTVTYLILSAVFWLPMKIRIVGSIFPAVFALVSCMVSYWLVGRVVPGTIQFGSFLAGLPLAFLNMIFVWALTLVAVPNRPDRPYFPISD